MNAKKQITIGEAVRILRKKKGFTIEQLADQVPNYDGGNLSRFETGKQRIVDDKLEYIAKALGVSVAGIYLLMETGDPDSISKNNVSNNSYSIGNTKSTIYNAKKIPFLTVEQALNIDVLREDMKKHKKWIETSAQVSDKSFALKVVGDSMLNPYGQPSIPEGATVIVDPEIKAVSGKIVIAKLCGSKEITLKKLVIDGPNKYLSPLNPNYKAFEIDDSCEIIGVVKQMEVEF